MPSACYLPLDRWSVCIPTASLLLIALVCSWIPRRQIRTRQELLSGLLLSNVLLLRHTTVLVEGAQKLPNIREYQLKTTAFVSN